MNKFRSTSSISWLPSFLANARIAKTGRNTYSSKTKLFSATRLVPSCQILCWKTATNQEIEETLDHIRQHLQNAEPLIQWTMNQCLVEIAVAYPDYLEQGLAIGQELAVYVDMKVPKAVLLPTHQTGLRLY